MLTAITFLLGAAVGSFLNVVITRLPRNESLVIPASYCRHCGAPIRWQDNIPILSFLLLRGRCRACRAPIAWQYPAVEAVTAGLFWLAVWRIGWRIELIPAWLFLSALIAITAIDLKHQIIPDRITLPGILFGFLANLLTGKLSLMDAGLGALLGGGIFFLIILVSGGGMGGGDMKLGAMIGAFLGWKLALLTIFFAVFVGGVIGTGLLLAGVRGRKDPIPFGPFLALGSIAALLGGDEILRWYLRGFVS